MRIVKTFLFLTLMLFLVIACENQTDKTEPEVVVQEDLNPDEVTNRWYDAWRNNQFDSVSNMTADDAVLLLNGQQLPPDSLNNWLEQASTSMRDLELSSIAKGGQGDIAWDSGTFSHSYAEDSTTYGGTYTFVWERTDEDRNDWKVRLMNITGNHEADSLQMTQ